MIPEAPTDENIKPVMDLMLPELVYTLGQHPGGDVPERRETFRWIDTMLAEINGRGAQVSEVHHLPCRDKTITVVCTIHESLLVTVDP